ncbi:Uncharacterised protein [Serratia fonticola]|uniref:hypothetical protein n=1 Tax=Serratia fonticola TaxID=47917 RepID=UPI0021833616|nr:hypothetical protein [Serratia fonticola]CAI2512584.1 Uncharacterised protein [Serratia fonticola]
MSKKKPLKYIIDTNVPKTANLAIIPDKLTTENIKCVKGCVELIERIVNNSKSGLVLDTNNEIFDEYRAQLNMGGNPGMGDMFMKWLHDNRWSFPDQDRVKISKSGDSYEEFPTHDDLTNFDISDRKFVAVSNAHPSKPCIYEATDSKWWGWKEALNEVGINVIFIDDDYIKEIYTRKMGG